MDWGELSFVAIGLSIYSFGLLTKSRSLKHFRLGRLFNITKIRNLSPAVCGAIQILSFSLSFSLISFGIWSSTSQTHDMFLYVVIFGVCLIVVRMLGFVYPSISIGIMEIETDPEYSLTFGNVCRSPFVVGGIILVLLSGGGKYYIDYDYKKRLNAYQQLVLKEHDDWIKKKDFYIKFKDRAVTPQNLSDTSIMSDRFVNSLGPGDRILLVGRAGIGKTWYMRRLFELWKNKYPDKYLIFLNASDVEVDEGIVYSINRKIVPSENPYTLPLTIEAVNNAVIVIDGIDESNQPQKVESKLVELARILPDSIVVVSSRFFNFINKEFRDSYVEWELSPLTTSLSDEALSRGIKDNIKDIRTIIGRHIGDEFPVADLGYSYDVLSVSEDDEIYRLFRDFMSRFHLNYELVDENGRSMYAFYNTFRDVNVVLEVFGSFLDKKIEADGSDGMQRAILNSYLQGRISGNYKSQDHDVVESRSNEVLQQISEVSRRALKRGRGKEVVLTQHDFLGNSIEGNTLENIVFESEIMVRKKTDKGYVYFFNNPFLDKFFTEAEEIKGMASN